MRAATLLYVSWTQSTSARAFAYGETRVDRRYVSICMLLKPGSSCKTKGYNDEYRTAVQSNNANLD